MNLILNQLSHLSLGRLEILNIYITQINLPVSFPVNRSPFLMH
ncbi:hypothetical protein PHLH4_34250 [Pseudomonas sp. St316]|nr:hypothetical protein PHLH4_34250 [Pseudomonas sp. St316]